MEIKYKLEKSSCKTCVALGFFDGVHLGHQAVIKSAIEKAKLTHTVPAVFTFLQNPKSVAKGVPIKNITTREQKEKLLCDIGVQLLYCVDFLEIMNLSPAEFVEQILINIMQSKYVFCGFNFRFGKNAVAGADELVEICKKFGIKVYVTNPVKSDGVTISSSQIRELIISGDTERANILLGTKFLLKKIK